MLTAGRHRLLKEKVDYEAGAKETNFYCNDSDGSRSIELRGHCDPPRDLLVRNDHAGLEAWYLKEAADLRQRAKEMMVMAEEYQKNPGPSTRGVVPSKTREKTMESSAQRSKDVSAEYQAEVSFGP